MSKTGRTRTEQIFCITDLTPEQADPGQLLALNRGHWSIENRLHWARDVTPRSGYGAQRRADRADRPAQCGRAVV